MRYIYKQLYLYLFQLETSQSKINEFHSEMDATNEWMDETEKLLKSFSVGMEPEEATKLQEKTEVWFLFWSFFVVVFAFIVVRSVDLVCIKTCCNVCFYRWCSSHDALRTGVPLSNPFASFKGAGLQL